MKNFNPFLFFLFYFPFFVIVIVRQCLHSLNQEQFLIQTQKNAGFNKWLEFLVYHWNFSGARVPTWNSSRAPKKKEDSKKARSRDHRLAQRRQHRQREKEEQETSIESGSISFSSQKPFTCIHDLITFYINIYIHFLLCFEDKVQL